jgi:hypothetical protein
MHGRAMQRSGMTSQDAWTSNVAKRNDQSHLSVHFIIRVSAITGRFVYLPIYLTLIPILS